MQGRLGRGRAHELVLAVRVFLVKLDAFEPADQNFVISQDHRITRSTGDAVLAQDDHSHSDHVSRGLGRAAGDAVVQLRITVGVLRGLCRDQDVCRSPHERVGDRLWWATVLHARAISVFATQSQQGAEHEGETGHDRRALGSGLSIHGPPGGEKTSFFSSIFYP